MFPFEVTNLFIFKYGALNQACKVHKLNVRSRTWTIRFRTLDSDSNCPNNLSDSGRKIRKSDNPSPTIYVYRMFLNSRPMLNWTRLFTSTLTQQKSSSDKIWYNHCCQQDPWNPASRTSKTCWKLKGWWKGSARAWYQGTIPAFSKWDWGKSLENPQSG